MMGAAEFWKGRSGDSSMCRETLEFIICIFCQKKWSIRLKNRVNNCKWLEELSYVAVHWLAQDSIIGPNEYGIEPCLCVLTQILYTCTYILLLICSGPALSLSLGDVSLVLEFILLINIKSAQRKGQKKNRKGQQKHAPLSRFHPAASFSSHLAPSTPGPTHTLNVPV